MKKDAHELLSMLLMVTGAFVIGYITRVMNWNITLMFSLVLFTVSSSYLISRVKRWD